MSHLRQTPSLGAVFRGKGNTLPVSQPTRRNLLAAGVTLASVSTAAAAQLSPTIPMVAGPFYPEPKDRPLDMDTDLTAVFDASKLAIGTVIHLSGQIRDLSGSPVENAQIELWQADAKGRYHHPADPNVFPWDENFQGYGRQQTGSDGRYGFKTVRPGSYPMDAYSTRAPHIHLLASSRDHEPIATQLFFHGESMNDQDVILHSLSEADQEKLIVEYRHQQGSERDVLFGEFEFVLA